jgi:Skp family chaperone for outer membrane proteins
MATALASTGCYRYSSGFYIPAPDPVAVVAASAVTIAVVAHNSARAHAANERARREQNRAEAEYDEARAEHDQERAELEAERVRKAAEREHAVWAAGQRAMEAERQKINAQVRAAEAQEKAEAEARAEAEAKANAEAKAKAKADVVIVVEGASPDDAAPPAKKAKDAPSDRWIDD